MASSASISVVTDRFMVNPSCYDRYILFALGSGFASVTNLVGQFIGNDGTKVRSLDALGSLLDGAARGGVMTTLTVLIDPPIDAMLIGTTLVDSSGSYHHVIATASGYIATACRYLSTARSCNSSACNLASCSQTLIFRWFG